MTKEIDKTTCDRCGLDTKDSQPENKYGYGYMGVNLSISGPEDDEMLWSGAIIRKKMDLCY